MIGKYITWFHYQNQNKEFISKLDNSLRKSSSLEGNICCKSIYYRRELSLVTKGNRVKVLTEILKKLRNIEFSFLKSKWERGKIK